MATSIRVRRSMRGATHSMKFGSKMPPNLLKIKKEEDLLDDFVKKELSADQNDDTLRESKVKVESDLEDTVSNLLDVSEVTSSTGGAYACSETAAAAETGEKQDEVSSHDGPPFRCSVCGRAYTRLGMLYRHERLHVQANVKSVHCVKCGSKFNTRHQLTTHMRHAHSHCAEKTCGMCNRVFKTVAKRMAHKCSNAAGGQFACIKCDAMFATSEQLSCHVTSHVDDQRHTCETCGQTYARRDLLVKHRRKHVTRLAHVCARCGASFSERNRLTMHEKTHRARRDHKCATCGREFVDRAKLVVHERIHTGERPFPCNICEKAFNEQGTLKRHYRVHTGERPFACTACDDKFALRHQLLRHSMLKHCGEGHMGKIADAYRSCYPCATCGKILSDMYNLHMHEQIHIRNFSCTLCDASFTQKFLFKRHMKQHEDEGT